MDKVFQALLRFFGAVASALTGLGAICTAAGFLAERTRWSMLGLGTVSVDLNEYLFTGSRFLAFLPGILLTTALTVLTGSGRIFLLALALPLLAVLARVLLRRPSGMRLRQGIAAWSRTRRRPLLLTALLGLAVLQFIGTLFLFRAAGIRNLLFAVRAPAGGCGDARLPLDAQIRLGCEGQLDQSMGEVFLVVLASGVLLWVVLRVLASERYSIGEQVLAGVNVSLLVVQLVLLPINYGVLFLRNEFPVVQVALAGGSGDAEAPSRAEAGNPAVDASTLSERPQRSASREAWPEDGRFYLLQRRGDEFYLYSRGAARVWLVPRETLASVVYLGICRLFRPEGALVSDACRFEEGVP